MSLKNVIGIIFAPNISPLTESIFHLPDLCRWVLIRALPLQLFGRVHGSDRYYERCLDTSYSLPYRLPLAHLLEDIAAFKVDH
jgi:hypothetical protein